ncbi:MAG TPA: nucleoside recognition domain-containing protein [Vicinamibacterales bacterium]|nr:nucleoside recognition domain-containing protein [Vicinamibacterales bacterium]
MIRDLVNAASSWIVALLILGVPLYAYAAKRIRVYESFIEGAKEGFEIGVRIMPYLVAILVAIGMFRASGAMDWLVWILQPMVAWAGFPVEALPSSLMRSLSGSAAFAMSSEIFKIYGPDSFVGRLVSVIQGSTETTFYIMAVYYGCVAVRKTRYTLAASLITDVSGIVAAFIICSLLF